MPERSSDIAPNANSVHRLWHMKVALKQSPVHPSFALPPDVRVCYQGTPASIWVAVVSAKWQATQWPVLSSRHSGTSVTQRS